MKPDTGQPKASEPPNSPAAKPDTKTDAEPVASASKPDAKADVNPAVDKVVGA
jgi:hypothetical protein